MESPEVVCLKRNQSVPYQVKISPHHDHEDHVDTVELCLDPVKASIARLSDEDIRRMSYFDMVELTKLSGVFSPREWTNSLRFMDLDELRLSVFLARRLCRQDVNDSYKRQGRQVLYLKI